MPEAQDDNSIFLWFDRFVNVPAWRKMRKEVGHSVGTEASCRRRLWRPPYYSLPTMTSNPRPVVFMDINIGETPAGRLKMELFSDIVPKSVRLIHTILSTTCWSATAAQDRRELQTVMYRGVQVSGFSCCIGIEPDSDFYLESTQDRKGIKTRHFIGIHSWHLWLLSHML